MAVSSVERERDALAAECDSLRTRLMALTETYVSTAERSQQLAADKARLEEEVAGGTPIALLVPV